MSIWLSASSLFFDRSITNSPHNSSFPISLPNLLTWSPSLSFSFISCVLHISSFRHYSPLLPNCSVPLTHFTQFRIPHPNYIVPHISQFPYRDFIHIATQNGIRHSGGSIPNCAYMSGIIDPYFQLSHEFPVFCVWPTPELPNGPKIPMGCEKSPFHFARK